MMRTRPTVALLALAASMGGSMGGPIPLSDEERRNRREKRSAERLARKDRLVAKADAKRARKAAKRLSEVA